MLLDFANDGELFVACASGAAIEPQESGNPPFPPALFSGSSSDIIVTIPSQDLTTDFDGALTAQRTIFDQKTPLLALLLAMSRCSRQEYGQLPLSFWLALCSCPLPFGPRLCEWCCGWGGEGGGAHASSTADCAASGVPLFHIFREGAAHRAGRVSIQGLRSLLASCTNQRYLKGCTDADSAMRVPHCRWHQW